MRETTYYPKLCLVQLGVAETTYVLTRWPRHRYVRALQFDAEP